MHAHEHAARHLPDPDPHRRPGRGPRPGFRDPEGRRDIPKVHEPRVRTAHCRTVEAYVDDIVVKTRKASDHLSDLETTFRCLKAKGVNLNPEKCVFGVPRGMLLGFIISERGIEANPEKIGAITNMGPSRT